MFCQPASLVSTIWVTLAGIVTTSLILAWRIIARYGEWVYTTRSEQFALCAFLAAAGVLLGVVGGVLLWAGLELLHRVRARLGATALTLLACAATAAWIYPMLTHPPIRVYADTAYVTLIAVTFAFGWTVARGERPWQMLHVTCIVGAGLAMAVAGVWLNLSFIRRADSQISSNLNAALLLTFGLVSALGVFTCGRPETARGRGKGGGSTASLWPLFGLVAVALATVPFWYRLALAAGRSLPATDLGTRGEPASASRLVAEIEPRPPSVRNVILISLDTQRPDHLGIYGYEMPTSPNIDRFFARAAVFTQAYSQSPWTLPSHMSMMTGLHASAHGVRVHPTQVPGYVDRLPEQAVTLAEILRDAGMSTGGFTGGGFVSSRQAIDQGFDDFAEAKSLRMAEVLDEALPWLRRHAEEPFFLLLHSYDVHRYNPPRLFPDISDGGYQGALADMRESDPLQIELNILADGFWSLSQSDLAFIKYLYDTEIRNVDRQLERLFQELADLDLLQDTAVILTSDHGEHFYEHGHVGHTFNLYDPVLRVPLLVRLPSLGSSRRIDGRAQTVDIAPTVLDLLALYPKHGKAMQGQSLLPAILGAELDDRPIVCEADGLDTQAALFLGRYKYIDRGVLFHNLLDPRFILLSLKGLLSPYAGQGELFDLEADPEEKHNLASVEPDRVREYRRLLFDEIRSIRTAYDGVHTAVPGRMTPELEHQLRSLGYLQ